MRKRMPCTLSCKRGDRMRPMPAALLRPQNESSATGAFKGAMRTVLELVAFIVRAVRVEPGAVACPPTTSSPLGIYWLLIAGGRRWRRLLLCFFRGLGGL